MRWRQHLLQLFCIAFDDGGCTSQLPPDALLALFGHLLVACIICV
jgi:hypothetical protein